MEGCFLFGPNGLEQDGAGQPRLPCIRSGYRKERDGLSDNRYLRRLVKSRTVNLGSLQRHDKMNSPSRGAVGGGAAVVV